MQNSSSNKWRLHGGALSFGGSPTWTYEREHDEKTCETSMVNLIQFIRFVSVWMRRGNLSDRNPKRSWREMEYHFLVSVCLFIWRSFTRENGFKSSDSSDARVKCDVKKNCVSRINTARSSYQLSCWGEHPFFSIIVLLLYLIGRGESPPNTCINRRMKICHKTFRKVQNY